MEILAEPKLRLIKAKYPESLKTIWAYQDTYDKIGEYVINIKFYGGVEESFTLQAKTIDAANKSIQEYLAEERPELSQSGPYEIVHEKYEMVNGERLKIGAYSAGIVENQPRNLP